MVTSYKISENEMGYRGSKSEILNPQPNKISVKEQRVDGSYCINNNSMQLRCTLTGFERNYPVKIPSKQLKYRSFSNLNLKPELNPWFLTGFTDAEGCFSIKIQPNAKLKTKWRVRPVFSITLHGKDLSLLKDIQNTLGVGKISKSGEKLAIYAVDSIKEIPVILNHFDKYPLITNKLSDYLIFKQCFEIIKQGEHLTQRGLLELIALKSSLNLGLPDNLKNFFPSIILKNRPEFIFKGIPDPFWISGFTSGDGSFHIVSRKSVKKSGIFVRFGIHLHIRELEILKGIDTYLKLYNTEISTDNSFYKKDNKENKEPVKFKKLNINKKSVNLQITKFSDIVNIIIPFFNQYPILGIKSLDFLDFKKICEILKTKEHLSSPKVINLILKIKSGMNQNRK
jgi:LAGLIDADG endonuclease